MTSGADFPRLTPPPSILCATRGSPFRLIVGLFIMTIDALGASTPRVTPGSDDVSSYVVIREDSSSHNATIRRCETLLIEFPEHLTTGFVWVITKVDSTFWSREALDNAELERLRAQGVLRRPALDDKSFGRDDWRIFHLKPKRVGSTQLEFHEARPWQPDDPATIFTLRVTIKTCK